MSGVGIVDIIIAEAEEQLLTINDMLRWALSRFFEADLYFGHGTDNAWDEAIALILQSLHLPHDVDQRILGARLTQSERKKILILVQKRIEERVPLPYLMHRAWFCGLEFYVDERVLIPRSPMAELIEQHFTPWFSEPGPKRVLDLCTGSGCIAIAIAAYLPEAEVVGSDLSEGALDVAKMNVERHRVDVELIQSDLFDTIPKQSFDLIISNPPYVNLDEMKTLPQEYCHEPRLALEAQDEGLAIVESMLRSAVDYLTDEGYLIVEVGNSQAVLAQRYPKVPFVWLDFERGGDGVFLLGASDLKQHFSG